jgi:hypothetical protein
MSYRSEVRCLIYGDALTMMRFRNDETASLLQQPTIRRNQEITRYRANVNCSPVETVSKEIEILDLNGGNWKWYANIAAVSDWYRFMDKAERAGLEYEFLRVGEGVYQGVNDIEYEASESSLGLLKGDRPGFYEPVC